MSDPMEKIRDDVEFDMRHGAYQERLSLGRDGEPSFIDLETVVTTTDRDSISLYFPGITIAIDDFGLPRRELIIEGDFPGVEKPSFAPPSKESLVIRWSNNQYERATHYTELKPGDHLVFAMPRTRDIQRYIDGRTAATFFDPSTPIYESYSLRENEDEIPILLLAREGSKLKILLDSDLTGEAIYHTLPSMNERLKIDDKPNDYLVEWLAGLGVDPSSVNQGLIDELTNYFREHHLMSAENQNLVQVIKRQRREAAEMQAEQVILRNRVREIEELYRLNALLGKQAFRTSSARETVYGVDKTAYCAILGIDITFLNSLQPDQAKILVGSARRGLARIFHSDKGEDGQRMKEINDAADKLLELL